MPGFEHQRLSSPPSGDFVIHGVELRVHLLIFEAEECEYTFTVGLTGCHKHTHWTNVNPAQSQCMFHSALCAGGRLMPSGCDGCTSHRKEFDISRNES